MGGVKSSTICTTLQEMFPMVTNNVDVIIKGYAAMVVLGGLQARTL